ncbi:hypothetical protein HMSSN036_25210 [Paenibacillus macerans]|nr:hypothetical protein HMSSN036_25210 [Paenibacillus macerans]
MLGSTKKRGRNKIDQAPKSKAYPDVGDPDRQPCGHAFLGLCGRQRRDYRGAPHPGDHRFARQHRQLRLFADKPTDEYGLAKTATLIKQAREEAKNSVLIDNGDLIQGNPLGDYVATVEKLQEGQNASGL